MLSIVYGLTCALFYGSADYAGGRASRKASSIAVTASSQWVGWLFILVVVNFLGGDGWTTRSFVVGALGGACGAIGLMLLYRALSLAAMSVVSPITAVMSAVVPVVAGVIIGEGLTFVHGIGVALALTAIGLISRGGDTDDDAHEHHRRPTPALLATCLIAGVFFGLFVVALDRAGDDVGVWPLVAAKPIGVLFAIGAALATRQSPIVAVPALGLTLVAGVADMTANVFAALSAQAGQVAIAGVLVSLYPASTVVLSRIVDHEPLTRGQLVGFALAVAALLLIAL
jgi:drug/metabolite transporter (DMT)-like permease